MHDCVEASYCVFLSTCVPDCVYCTSMCRVEGDMVACVCVLGPGWSAVRGNLCLCADVGTTATEPPIL